MRALIRVVVDLSDGPQGAALAEIGDALATVISAAPPRVALVVTDAQRPHLPTRFARDANVQLVAARDATIAWARIARLAEGGAVVVSSRRYSPLLHWIAVEWAPMKDPVLTPPDGMERWKKGLGVDDVPVAASLRDLSMLVDPVDAQVPPRELTSTPGKLRELVANLSYGREVIAHSEARNGAAAPADPRTRLAWGRSLDVPVAATEAEWGILLVERAKALGAGVIAVGGETEVAAQRAKVARGASPSRAVLSGSALHLVNPVGDLRTQMASLHAVFIHDEAPRPSGFERVRELAREVPSEAWLDDPFMDAALERIDPKGVDRDELEFARASLLLHDRLRPSAAPRRRDWRALLSAIVAHDPPAVALRVPVTVGEGASKAVLLPHREVDRRASLRGKELVGIRALAPTRVTRDDALVALEPATERVGSGEWNAWVAQRRYLLPAERVIDDMEALVDLFVRAPSRNAMTPDLLRWWNHSPEEHQLGLFWPSTPIKVAPTFWRDADRQLGMLWIALRRALSAGLDTTLHDGVGLLEMGGGHVAEVTATARGPAAHGASLEADFGCVFERSDRADRAETDERVVGGQCIVRGVGARAAVGPGSRVEVVTRVPRALHLAYGDARVEVVFEATPWEAAGESAARRESDVIVAGAVTAEWPNAGNDKGRA